MGEAERTQRHDDTDRAVYLAQMADIAGVRLTDKERHAARRGFWSPRPVAPSWSLRSSAAGTLVTLV
jgi:hypothetical protein